MAAAVADMGMAVVIEVVTAATAEGNRNNQFFNINISKPTVCINACILSTFILKVIG